MTPQQKAFMAEIVKLAQQMKMPVAESAHVFGYLVGGLAIGEILLRDKPPQETFAQYLDAFGVGFQESSDKLEQARLKHQHRQQH